jgi:glycosyltransferase involved in cell wall biosynthesis
MKILHIGTYDVNGGAARAAYRIHKGLLHLGIDSMMFVRERRSDDPKVVAFKPPTDLPSRLLCRLQRKQIDRGFARYRNILGSKLRTGSYYTNTIGELFSDYQSEHGKALISQLPQCDIINLHWIAGFIDYRVFFDNVNRRTPIVWRLSDMNAFTGGCHYNNGCNNFTARCGLCPILGSSSESDLSRRIWSGKQFIFNNVDPEKLHIVAPSRWMAYEVRRSSLLGKYPVTIIPSGVDTEMFAPRDRQTARDVLGIPQGSNVVLFVSGKMGNVRKGFDLLRGALSALAGQNQLFLVSVGSGKITGLDQIPHLHIGRIENDRWLSLVYSAADLFVIPSIQDNLPSTVLESMACGTPVVGFNTGGIADMVMPGITGQLASSLDENALCSAIISVLGDPGKRRAMGANSRRLILENHTLDVQAERYIDLYKSILGQS